MNISRSALILIVLGFLFNFAVYFWNECKYLSKHRILSFKSTDPDFEIGREISDKSSERDAQVNNSNIATDFQLSTIYPNIVFGIIGNIFVPLSNAVSFLIGGFLYQRIFQNAFPIFFGTNTLHSFIADSHDQGRSRRYWALFSIFGFAVAIAFEVTFLASLLKLILGYEKIFFYLFICSVVTFAIWFTVRSGQRIVFGSDQVLLLLSYVGIHGILIGLFYTLDSSIKSSNTLIAIMLLVMMGSIISRTADMLPFKGSKFSSSSRTIIFNSIVVGVTAVTFFSGSRIFSSAGMLAEIEGFSLSRSFENQTAGSLAAMLLAITIPALCWRFVDFSFWQRNKAIYFCLSRSEIQISKNKTSGSWSYIFESALTYILPILIGIFVFSKWPALKAVVDDQSRDPVAESISLLLSGNMILFISGILFVWGLIAISLSTVSEYFVSIATSFGHDLFSHKGPDQMTYGRISMIYFGAGTAIIIVIIEGATSSVIQIVGAMIGSLGILTALSPLILYPLCTGCSLRTDNFGKWVYFATPIAGAAIALFYVFIMPYISPATPVDIGYWIATPAAFLLSWTIYYGGVRIFGVRNIDFSALCSS